MCRETTYTWYTSTVTHEHIHREETLRHYMAHAEITPLNLFAMAKRLFRGRFDSRGVQATMFFLETIDTVILRAAPFLKRYCGELIVVATK